MNGTSTTIRNRKSTNGPFVEVGGKSSFVKTKLVKKGGFLYIFVIFIITFGYSILKNTSTNSSHLLDGDTPSIKSNYHNTNGIESQHRKTGPQASYNAKEYNPDWYNKSLTGAWANCTERL